MGGLFVKMPCGHEENEPIPESAYCNRCLCGLMLDAEEREPENIHPRLRANYEIGREKNGPI
jgi:hypothetical protein